MINKEKSLRVINNNIFYKIKHFFIRLFKKELTKDREEKQIINRDYNFKESIIIKEDENLIRLEKLQQEFEEGKISEEDMKDDDIVALHELYDKQIKNLQDSTETYKMKILKIKKKLAE